MKKNTKGTTTKKQPTSTKEKLYDDVLTMIEASCGRIVKAKEVIRVPLYWRIGKCIRDAVRGNWESDHSQKVIANLSIKLGTDYGKEYTDEKLTRMVEFSAQFPDYEMITTLAKQLTWEHFQRLIEIDDDIQRDFYAWMCLAKGWSTKALNSKIQHDLYGKTPADAIESQISDNSDSSDEMSSSLASRAHQIWSLLGLGNSK